MERIIATTDFSENSRPGIRFAIQLAQSRNAELILVHVYEVLRATFWTDQVYEQFIERGREAIMRDFPDFVRTTYHSIGLTPPADLKTVAHHNLDPVDGIIEFARQQNASYICIATRGAGLLRKIFGTNTSKLIRLSPVPVICVPGSYQFAPISKIMYASDMKDYSAELSQVVAFARPMNARVELLHIAWSYEMDTDKEALEQELKEQHNYEVQLHYQPNDLDNGLLDQINNAVERSEPSLLVFFTHQDRDLYDRLLLSGNAKDFSFDPTIPMLSIPKSPETGNSA